MKRYLAVALAAGVAVGACKDNPTSAPQDAPTVDALKNLTPVTLKQLAVGVTGSDRAAYATTGVLVLPEILARDIYRIDASENRYVNETLGGQADPGSFAGGSGFAGFYTATRAASTAINALNSPSVLAPGSGFTAATVNASKGFFKTFKALDFYRVIEQRDTIGIPLQTDDPQAITPVYCKPYVLNYIAALLDSANADLVASAGATLPFTLPPSFTAHGRDYQKAANLIRFNRGLKGKVDFYRAMLNRAAPDAALLNQAITELDAALGTATPGGVPAAQFPTGIYYHFDPVEISNVRADAKISANKSLADSVRFHANAIDATAPWDPTDTRLAQVITRPDSATGGLVGNGLTTYHTFTFATATSANQVAQIPLLKDEELVLLRAQAYAELGGANLANAYADAQSVHAAYGTNPLPAFTTTAMARRYILREKRLSLLFQGPQRLVDLRAYGYLNETYLPKELPSDPFNSAFPLPRAELNARGVTSNPACSAS